MIKQLIHIHVFLQMCFSKKNSLLLPKKKKQKYYRYSQNLQKKAVLRNQDGTQFNEH